MQIPVPSLPPGSLQCTALSSQSIRVAWDPPPTRGRNGVLQGYRVTYAPVTEWFGKWKNLQEIPTRIFGGAVDCIFFGGLVYSYEVIAQINT